MTLYCTLFSGVVFWYCCVYRATLIPFLGAMGVIDAVMGSDDQHRSVIEKGWREGHEYFRVEPQLICHDGESIQVGGYISQLNLQLIYLSFF